MSNGNNVSISFRAEGGNLSNYIDSVDRKNKTLYDNVASNIERQNSRSKEQNKLIADQIALLTKRSQVELQAERNILSERRKREINLSNSSYDTKADAVYGNTRLSDKQREAQLKRIEQERRNDESYIRNKYRDRLDDNTGELRRLSVARNLQRQKAEQDKRMSTEQVLREREKYGTGNPDFSIAPENLQNYISRRKNRSSTLFNTALADSKTQNKEGREQLEIIEKQIAAIGKKSQAESSAAQNILQMRRNGLLNSNKSYFSGQRESVNKSTTLDSVQKAIRLEAINLAEKDRAATINSKYGESLSTSRETERQSRLQTTLAKEQIETIKQKASENVKAITNGDLKLADVFKNATTDQEKLVAQLTKEGVDSEKRQKGSGSETVKGIAAYVAMQGTRELIQSGTSLTQTQNGFDIIGQTGNTLGRVAGGILGGAIAALFSEGIGVVAGAGVGSEIGGALGGGVGALQQRQAIIMQQNLQAKNKYKSITGVGDSDIEADDLSGIGINGTQFLQLQAQYARLRGNRASSMKTATDAAYLERGYGVDQSSSAAVIEMQRSGKENNRDLAGLIGGVLQRGQNNYFKGGDTSFLNEFLSKFIALQKQLLQNQTTVATGTTFDILSRFNRVGGAFSTTDPRSGGLVSTVNSAISNPQGDFSRALTMYAIRKANPNISNPLELMIQMQKGLAGGNLDSIYSVLNKGNSPEWAKRMSLAGMTGLGGQLAFGSDLFTGFKNGAFKGKLSTTELNAAIPGLKDRAEGNTAPLEQNEASITNGILSGKGIEAMTDALKVAVMASLKDAVVEIDGGRIKFLSAKTISDNAKKENVARDAENQHERKVLRDRNITSYGAHE